MQPQVLNGRYQLEQVLGRGGMATVYRARDLKLGRPVAIKILHDFYASDPQFRRRFELEAQSAANLSDHPNIVDIYDVGQDGDTPYIVMEFIDGGTLKDLIDHSGGLPVEQAVSIAQQIAEGLDAAHRRGLVHRDIKPQNIMVPADGQVRIADFGIAKGMRSPGMTDPGITFGTAEYISPEQVQGQPATPQSDIYSLGIAMFEMLTGQLPFNGDSPMAVAMQHIQVPPPAPRALNARIPPRLEAIVLSALAKDPVQRPATARALAQQLATYRERGEGQTMVAPAVAPPSTPRPQPRPGAGRPFTAPVPTRPAPPPQRPVIEDPPRGGGGCVTFVLGLALLAGILGLLFVLFQTDLVSRLPELFPAAPTSAPADQPQPTFQPTPTAGLPTPTTVETVAVPDLVGQTDADARRLLQEAGLSFTTTAPENSRDVPQGFVIRQDLQPGTQIPRGATVSYTVSLGPQLVDVPDVRQQPFAAASAQLEALGLQVNRIDQPSRDLPAGTVADQNPPPGERVPAGTAVSLLVSAGDIVIMPDVIGIDRGAAEQLVQSTDGLVLLRVDEQGPEQLGADFERFAPNTVVSATANGQPVVNGQSVGRGSEIVLGVRRP